jgi:glutamine amidotransferase
MIAIIDYGMGNIHSVRKALESCGGKTLVTNNPEDIERCEKLVLPGVGAFADAISEIKKQGLAQVIKKNIKKGKAFLGICLGMQLLFESSLESPKIKGLGLLKGEVKKFLPKKGLKIPHMGWNQIEIKNTACPILQGIKDKSFVYFCHSYYPRPLDKKIIAATTDYGADFASIICKDNIYAMQFHPEKSQAIGLKIIENFVKL